MITLYYAPKTRSGRVRWLLEELEAPYTLQRIDLRAGEQKKPEYLKIHPHGKLPALRDGDLVLIESGAICAYLTEKFSEKGLIPPAGTAERALYYQWLFYGAVTMDACVVSHWQHTEWLPADKRNPEIAASTRVESLNCLGVVAGALEGKEFLLGGKFTMADIMIGSLTRFAGNLGLLEDRPTLKAYVERLNSRAAFQRAAKD